MWLIKEVFLAKVVLSIYCDLQLNIWGYRDNREEVKQNEKNNNYFIASLDGFVPLIALAGNDQIRYEGTMMIFPIKEGVIDLDLDLFDVDFSNILRSFHQWSEKFIGVL